MVISSLADIFLIDLKKSKKVNSALISSQENKKEKGIKKETKKTSDALRQDDILLLKEDLAKKLTLKKEFIRMFISQLKQVAIIKKYEDILSVNKRSRLVNNKESPSDKKVFVEEKKVTQPEQDKQEENNQQKSQSLTDSSSKDELSVMKLMLETIQSILKKDSFVNDQLSSIKDLIKNESQKSMSHLVTLKQSMQKAEENIENYADYQKKQLQEIKELHNELLLKEKNYTEYLEEIEDNILIALQENDQKKEAYFQQLKTQTSRLLVETQEKLKKLNEQAKIPLAKLINEGFERIRKEVTYRNQEKINQLNQELREKIRQNNDYLKKEILQDIEKSLTPKRMIIEDGMLKIQRENDQSWSQVIPLKKGKEDSSIDLEELKKALEKLGYVGIDPESPMRSKLQYIFGGHGGSSRVELRTYQNKVQWKYQKEDQNQWRDLYSVVEAFDRILNIFETTPTEENQTTFLLPEDALQVFVFVNGVRQPSSYFSVVNNVVTYQKPEDGITLNPGDHLIFEYLIKG